MSSKKELQAKLKAVRASRKPTPAPKKAGPKDSHHLTDQLLALIEPSDLYRQSFGFTKISHGPVQTGGYRKQREKLGQMGAGLVNGENVEQGSDLKNIWGVFLFG
ncbi:hypothetical protein DFH08DRAFT_806952 [Mycena albidolilacea]|uniref:Uncharacterized protein n=1 Tax=Mycena albidolilacea TaxID=1033008 RepID=A0AAD7ESS0_9AGAR|nr:hypothetical protein DFH08DRAFT_806952 [Mycena albidolilacea]